MKPIEINFIVFNETHRARFWKSQYVGGENLYVGINTWNAEWECWEPWGDLTVNLGVSCRPNQAFLDTNNCAHEIIATLMDRGYIKDTGRVRQSGFCTYPLVEFTEEFLNNIVEQGDE